MDNLTVIEHPLAGHLLTELRDARTAPERFRSLTKRLATVLVLEAARSLPTRSEPVSTPVADTSGQRLVARVVAVPILRAGLGMLTSATELLPDVEVGYVGLERDEQTLLPSSYYLKVPELDGATVLVLDPMLATGGSASFALDVLRGSGATDLQLLCVVAAPEGVRMVSERHPDVRIITAALDERLNDVGYIVPGLGDFGDRLYGTF